MWLTGVCLMKRFAGVLLACALATPSFAGSVGEPLIEPEVIAEDTAASSGAGLLVPIFMLLFLAVAASAGGGGGNTVPPAVPPAS